MNNSPLISVLLPIYNGEKYLAEAIDSILAQTITDFELLVINDGSTDGTLAILQHYQSLDSRIRLISRENKGLVATLNEGIDLARGVWVARMDQDDIALPQRFERQLHYLAETSADMCGSWVKFFGTTDGRILKHPQTNAALNVALLFGSAFAHPSVMMKTALVRQLRYDSHFENAEDYDLWQRAAQAGWTMVNIPEVLLYYRLHTQQMSTASALEQQKLTQYIRQRHWLFLADSMDIKPEWIDEVIKMREPSASNLNMDAVDCVFNKLLQHHQGEARIVIFDHVTRLYFRVAANCPDIVTRWSRLNKAFGNGFGVKVKARLWLLKVLRIDSDSRLFTFLKKLYFYYTSRHHEKP